MGKYIYNGNVNKYDVLCINGSSDEIAKKVIAIISFHNNILYSLSSLADLYIRINNIKMQHAIKKLTIFNFPVLYCDVKYQEKYLLKYSNFIKTFIIKSNRNAFKSTITIGTAQRIFLLILKL